MRWLLGLCLALTVFSKVAAKPAALQDEYGQDVELEAEIMTQLLNKLLIPSQREARELVDAENDEDEMVTADAKMETDMAEATEEGDAKVLEDSEALREAKQMEVARFNNYIDAIYRRMNAALKAKLMDPMELNLDEKVKKNSEDKKKAKKSRVLREAVEDVDVEDQDQEVDIEVDRMGKPSNKGGNKKKGKGKSKEERQAEKQRKKDLRKKKKSEKDGKEKDVKEKDMSAKEKRRALKKNKRENKKKNDKKSSRESRSGQKNKKSGRKNKNNENKKNKNDKKKNVKGRGKSARKNIEDTKKNNKGKNKRDGKTEKMVGSLSGIATMERAGDVKVEDEDNHKVVSSEFSVGPLQLQVSKIYGKGKARTVKTAKAVTEVMSGTLVLKVKPDGTAHVKKVVFKKPENVEVKGKLSENNPRSLNSMRNSVNKMRPLAAMKILKTARYVLKSPTTKQ